MKRGKHIINRQVIELTLGKDENAWEIQQAVASAYRSAVIPVMDEVFTEFSGDHTVRFEMIELDLGTMTPSEIEREFARRVRARLREALLASSRQGNAESTAVGKAIGTTISAEKAAIELIRRFLRTGTLPWWAESPPRESLEETMLGLLDAATAEVQELLRMELAYENSRHRLVHQFSDSVLMKVMDVLHERPAGLRSLTEGLMQLYKEAGPALTPDRHVFRLAVWDTVLKAVTGRDHEPTETELLRAFLAQLSGRLNLPFREVARTLGDTVERLKKGRSTIENALAETTSAPDVMPPVNHDEGVRHPALRNGPPVPEKPLEGVQTDAASSEDAGRRPESGVYAEGHGETAVTHEKTYRRGSTAGTLKTGTPRTGREAGHTAGLPFRTSGHERTGGTGRSSSGLHVTNAGLVILWPYLGAFFRKIGLTGEHGFVDEASAERALHILQFLASGEEEDVPEYLLPLNKVLCGIDISRPVCRSAELSEEERAESEILLGTVVSHWTALKKTTVRGLRESFLKREGILSGDEESWLLKVERRAYDVLLERLPWGISVIRLSWMKRPLYVEW